jgi:hydrogenase nickel incorporation protein HypA/HybF
MHEYSIALGLLDRVEREASARAAATVLRIELRLGELSGVEEELLRSAWELVCAGTVCAGATLDVVRVAARWRCPRCATEPPPGGILRCPRCGVPAQLVAGDDLVLQRLELDVAQGADADGGAADGVETKTNTARTPEVTDV